MMEALKVAVKATNYLNDRRGPHWAGGGGGRILSRTDVNDDRGCRGHCRVPTEYIAVFKKHWAPRHVCIWLGVVHVLVFFLL